MHVWGRDWCLAKGFGLGSRPGLTWGRARVADIVFRVPTHDLDRVLTAASLLDLLDEVIFNRLALQALVLGATEPLTGIWVLEPRGPQLLRVSAGDLALAELVDVDRDDRVDLLFVSVRE